MRQLAGGLVFILLALPAPVSARVIFCEDACAPPPTAPSILFIPATEASALYGNFFGLETQHWPPTLLRNQSDAQALDLSSTGESIDPIYTKADGTIASIDSLFFPSLDIYRSFFAVLDQLKESGAIKSWISFPYDWRQSPDDIVANGTPYNDGPHFPTGVVEQLAQNGGKVIIIAHSNGGLIAKALMQKLSEKGEANLVSKIILVGVPQLGTPATLLATLHGDGMSIPSWGGFIVSQANARALSENMPDAYALLPSSAYFEKIAQPPITISTTSNFFAVSGINADAIASSGVLAQFLTEISGRSQASFADTLTPSVLSSSLLAKAMVLHSSLDSWTPPPGLDVIQVAGWGIDTVAGIHYDDELQWACSLPGCELATTTVHAPLWTEDGDEEVVSPSAASSSDWPTYYFQLGEYSTDANKKFSHPTIFSAQPLQNLLTLLIASTSPVSLPPYIYKNVPTASAELRLSVHSPVSLDAYDNQGRHTGMKSNPVAGSDFLLEEEQIPNSSYLQIGDDKYLNLPAAIPITVVLHGLAKGVFTFEADSALGDTIQNSVTFRNLPTTASTIATLSITNGSLSPLSLDVNGDGTPDFSSSSISDSLAYVRLLETTVSQMSLDKNIFKQLSAKLSNSEHLLNKDVTWDKSDDDDKDLPIGKKIERIFAYVTRIHDKIAPQDAATILNMLTELKTLVTS